MNARTNQPRPFDKWSPQQMADIAEQKRIAAAAEAADTTPHRIAGHQILGGEILGAARFHIEVEGILAASNLTIRRNLLADRLEIYSAGQSIPLTDDDLSHIRFSLRGAKNGREPEKEKVADALALIGRRNAYHPVRDYLAGLHWDGMRRLDTWLVEGFGADDTPLNRAVGRKMLCAAVRRAFQPGCKFDFMLVLQGAQGIRKSTAIAALCPERSWFSDQLEVGSDPKVTIEKTAGAWIIEMPELDGMSKRDSNRVKSYLSTEVDEARLAYGRVKTIRPRQFVLFGTTNEKAYLKDPTGNRRFWPVPCRKAEPAWIAKVRDQLWAEASAVERNEALYLDTPELVETAKAAAHDASDFGPWFDLLAERIPEAPNLKINVADLWRMVGIGPTDVNKLAPTHRSNMKSAMTGLGFGEEPKNLRDDGKQRKAYLRGDASKAKWWSPSVGGE